MSSSDVPGGTDADTATTGAPAPDVPPAKRPAIWKQLIAAAITIAVLVIVFFGIFPKFANYSEAWDAIQEMSVASLVLFGVFTILNIVVYVFPYQAALPGIGYPRAFIVRQTSFMISNAVPAGGAFGLGVQYAMLNSYGIGPAVASSAIGVTSVWNMLVTLALPALGLLALLITGEATGTMALGAIGALVALGVVVGALALVLRSERWALRIGGWGDTLLAKVRKGQAPDTVTQGVVRFRDQTVDVVEERWLLLTVTNFGQQLAQFSVLAVAIYGLGGASTGINLLEVFAAFALARLAGFIPITPGGLGTVDAALVGLLSAFGMSKDEALAANLLWRAATFIPQVVLGIITFIIWRVQRSRQLAHAAAPAAA
ncbi:lysylphosphatidylglycerol synthase transmembrane domain-containing protein [Dermatobacter hominis]|uniref:lysylphosphatidylglycerol synthase transmembrane domain-containing protein n=1 Tax=Dermatobacter hominis TaxID=2884263 RepID=UPI001D12B005|nr:YbhN family protein [Dermatobacter hominis]UDY34380.1 YbhN family protein [Dermatobacter hominis]